MNNKSLTKLGGSTVLPTTIGGKNVGDIGVGIYNGFSLTWGDDFWAKPKIWNGANIDGVYASSAAYIGFRRIGFTANSMIYIENTYRGARSQSPVPLNYDTVTFQGGIASITAKPMPAALLPYMPTTYTEGGGDVNNKPQLISGALTSWPSFMLSAKGNFIVEGKARFPAGIVRGSWPSLWTSTLNWPDYGEIDLFEGKKDVSGNVTTLFNLIVSATDGGGATFNTPSQPAVNTTRFIQFCMTKIGTTLTMYDDLVTEGTLAFRSSITDALVSRLRGSHYIKMEHAVDKSWDTSTLTLSDYPATMEYDWVRVWCPTGTNVNELTNNVGQINTTAGGSWAYTIPSNAVLFNGKSPELVEVYGAFDNADAPGCPTRLNRLPGGMTVNMTTRSVTGTVPLTEGGRVGLLFLGSYNAGGAVSRAMVYFNVAPVIITQLSNQTINYSASVDLTVAYTDFHSGNLGHTYTVTKIGGSWLTITGNGTSSVNIAGTSPSADESVVLLVTCANGVGQSVSYSRTITNVVSAGFNPATWSSVVEWWDASDNTKVFSDSTAVTQAVADSSLAAALVGKKNGYILNNAIAGTVPSYITDAANSLKSIKFARASNQRLANAADAALFNNATGSDNAYAVIGAFKRGAAGVSVTPLSLSRSDGTATNDAIRHFFGGTNTVGIQRISAGTAVTTSSSAAVGADQWYTVSWIFLGTTMTVKVDGVVVANALALDAASMTIAKMAIGSMYLNATSAYDATVAFDGAIGELIYTDSIAADDANIAQAEAYLMAKWHN